MAAASSEEDADMDTGTSSDSSDLSCSSDSSDDGSVEEPALKRFKLDRGADGLEGLGMGRVAATCPF